MVARIKGKKLDDEYKALLSADNLQSVVTEKKGDIEKLQTAAQRSIGRPLDTMDDFKSLTNKEIDALSKNVPSVSKAREHFAKMEAEKNRKKERKEEEKLIDLSKVEKIASTEQATGLLASYTNQAIGIQLGKQRFRKKIMNGEKNIRFFPFNGSLPQSEKEWYFKTFLQCPGFVSL